MQERQDKEVEPELREEPLATLDDLLVGPAGLLQMPLTDSVLIGLTREIDTLYEAKGAFNLEHLHRTMEHILTREVRAAIREENARRLAGGEIFLRSLVDEVILPWQSYAKAEIRLSHINKAWCEQRNIILSDEQLITWDEYRTLKTGHKSDKEHRPWCNTCETSHEINNAFLLYVFPQGVRYLEVLKEANRLAKDNTGGSQASQRQLQRHIEEAFKVLDFYDFQMDTDSIAQPYYLYAGAKAEQSLIKKLARKVTRFSQRAGAPKIASTKMPTTIKDAYRFTMVVPGCRQRNSFVTHLRTSNVRIFDVKNYWDEPKVMKKGGREVETFRGMTVTGLYGQLPFEGQIVTPLMDIANGEDHRDYKRRIEKMTAQLEARGLPCSRVEEFLEELFLG